MRPSKNLPAAAYRCVQVVTSSDSGARVGGRYRIEQAVVEEGEFLGKNDEGTAGGRSAKH